jgi:cysteine desulfurase
MTVPFHYFDNAATRRPLPAALATFARVSAECYGNPSSTHAAGLAAATELRRARAALCAAVHFTDGRLIATSGGTEADNLAIRGHLAHRPDARLLIAEDVHPAIWFAMEAWPHRCAVLPLIDGRLDVARVSAFLTDGITMVCLSHANNETGIVHPAAEIAALCRRRGVLCLVDGVQVLGHLPVDLAALPADAYTFSAHKFGGVRGVGGLLLRSDQIDPIFGGGGHEGGLRPGTENVAGLAAAAIALEESLRALPAETLRLRGLARDLWERFAASIPGILLNSDLDDGLPGLISCSVAGLTGTNAVAELDLLGFGIATGSACHADQILASRSILALGRSEAEALGTLRISLGPEADADNVAGLGAAIIDVVRRQRR